MLSKSPSYCESKGHTSLHHVVPLKSPSHVKAKATPASSAPKSSKRPHQPLVLSNASPRLKTLKSSKRPYQPLVLSNASPD